MQGDLKIIKLTLEQNIFAWETRIVIHCFIQKYMMSDSNPKITIVHNFN